MTHVKKMQVSISLPFRSLKQCCSAPGWGFREDYRTDSMQD